MKLKTKNLRLKTPALLFSAFCILTSSFGVKGDDAINYTAQFSWPAGATNDDVCGLYAQAPTNDWPHYLAAVQWPATNIDFSITNAVNGYIVPNPVNISVQVQRGTNVTSFSAAFLLDTNNFPEPFPLGAPVLLNLSPRY